MLNSQTPVGQIFMLHQRDTQHILEARGYKFIEMSRENSSHDVFIVKNIEGRDVCTGIAEIKCRMFIGNTLISRKSLKNGYLISYDKLTYGASASELFGIPYFVIVNLIPEKYILIWKLAENGDFLFDFPVRESQTKKNCNGGVAVRLNAYLPLEKAYELKYE